MGLARFGKLSVDGTKVRANASKRKAMSYERMGQEEVRLISSEIAEALLRKAGAVDAQMSIGAMISAAIELPLRVATQGESPGGDPGRQSAFGGGATCAAMMSTGASLGRTAIPGAGGPTSGPTAPEPKAQSNFTDPETPDHEDQQRGDSSSYNAQMAVDGEHQIIARDSGGATGQRPGSAGGDARRDQARRRLGSSLRW